MRLVQATVAQADLPDVERLLSDQDIEYFVTPEVGTDEYGAVVYASVAEDEVESVLSTLYEAGLDADDHATIIQTEVDIFGRTDGFQQVDSEHERIAAAELEGKVEDLLPDRRTYASMLVLSSLVATTGLLLDSAAVVVGAMVIAPLFGPAVSTCVGTVVDNDDLYRTGRRYQIAGVLVAVLTAVVFALIARVTVLAPSGISIIATQQIAARLSPDALSLVVALAAGVAGVLSIATGAGRALVGVMMAAALLPPAATVGIGLAWAEPTVAANSGLLLVVNVLAINLAGLATLWYLGYRPGTWVRLTQTRPIVLKRVAVLLLSVLVVGGLLVNVTYTEARQSELETTIEEDVSETLSQAAYENVSLVSVQAVQQQPSLFAEIDRVTVTVATPPGAYSHGLRDRIDDRVNESLGREVPVSVRVSLVIPESGSGESATYPDAARSVRLDPAASSGTRGRPI